MGATLLRIGFHHIDNYGQELVEIPDRDVTCCENGGSMSLLFRYKVVNEVLENIFLRCRITGGEISGREHKGLRVETYMKRTKFINKLRTTSDGLAFVPFCKMWLASVSSSR